MRLALHAEWTKLRTTPGPAGLLFATVTLTVALSAAAAGATHYVAGDPTDTTKLSLTGVQLGQAVVVVLAVLMIGGEYRTGMIRTTLAAVPRRHVVLTAKATLLTAANLAAGVVAVAGSVLAGRLILPSNGFTTAHGFATLTLGNGLTLRAAAGSALYLALIGLLALGVATAVRDSAVATGLVLALLYLFPIISHALNPVWQQRVNKIAPMTAGLYVQATTDLHGLPIGPWAGLGVLAAWAAVAMLAGALTLTLRDA